MTQPKTELVFTAHLGGIKVIPAPRESYRSDNGALELVLKIQAPSPPREPNKGWAMSNGPQAEPVKKKGEAQTTFDSRHLKWDAWKVIYEKESQEHALAMDKYHHQVNDLRDRLLSYAQLVGFSAIIGSKPVTVTITPESQDLLPGFSVALLSERRPEPVEGSQP